MMLIFGICIALGSLADMILTSFNFSNLILLVMGLLLSVIKLIGKKPGLLKSIARSLLSLLVISAVLLAFNFFLSEVDSMDKEIADIITESHTLEEEQGYESSLEFLHEKNIELGWDKELVLRMGEIYTAQSMYSEGAKKYHEILRKLPDDMATRQLYAKALYESKDYMGTLREGRYIARIDPMYGHAYVLMGDAYRGLNDNIREIYYYKLAVGLDETSVVNRLRLAEAYGSSHLHEKAVEQYEIAKELADTFEEDTLVYESYLRFADTDSENSVQEVQQ